MADPKDYIDEGDLIDQLSRAHKEVVGKVELRKLADIAAKDRSELSDEELLRELYWRKLIDWKDKWKPKRGWVPEYLPEDEQNDWSVWPEGKLEVKTSPEMNEGKEMQMALHKEIKDSGTRHEYETGAIRDTQENKGRCDLLPLNEVAAVLDKGDRVDRFFFLLDLFIREGGSDFLEKAIRQVVDITYYEFTRKASVEEVIIDVSRQYKAGAEKYGERNWELGMPLSSYIDSAVRHFLQYLAGHDDENHERAVIWNLLCCLWTYNNMFDMIDLPCRELLDESLWKKVEDDDC